MPAFPSAAWAEEYLRRLNSNPAYAAAARAWEGDVLLLVTADARAPNGEGVYLDLFHGTCREARYVTDPSSVRPEFIYRGDRAAWARVLRREVDPVKAILNGTFQLQGNLMKAARFTAAAKAMVDTAADVPTDPV